MSGDSNRKIHNSSFSSLNTLNEFALPPPNLAPFLKQTSTSHSDPINSLISTFGAKEKKSGLFKRFGRKKSTESDTNLSQFLPPRLESHNQSQASFYSKSKLEDIAPWEFEEEESVSQSIASTSRKVSIVEIGDLNGTRVYFHLMLVLCSCVSIEWFICDCCLSIGSDYIGCNFFAI